MSLVHSSAEDGASTPTCEAFAARLTGSEYGSEGSRELWAEMKAAGMVAIFGASDDLMEIRGAVDGEVGCYDGGSAWFTPDGLFEPECDCKYSQAAKREAVEVKAIWCPDDSVSWAYETTIPHATFNVVEDGETYCRGIVFALSDATPQGTGQ